LFTVLAGIAEFERDLIRERTRAGLRAARKRGKRLGRPRVVVESVALLEAIQRGETIASIARRLGVSRHVVRRELVAKGLSERRLGMWPRKPWRPTRGQLSMPRLICCPDGCGR